MKDEEFRTFFAFLYPKVLAYARTRIDGSTAEDVAAETLATMWRKQLPFPETEDERQMMTALGFRVAKGVLGNVARSARRKDRLTARMRSASPRAAEAGDIADDVTRRDEALTILNRLSENDREIIYLFGVEGITTERAAEILGCSVESVYMRLSRARRSLEMLEKKQGGAR